jgi:hypothetical protein
MVRKSPGRPTRKRNRLFSGVFRQERGSLSEGGGPEGAMGSRECRPPQRKACKAHRWQGAQRKAQGMARRKIANARRQGMNTGGAAHLWTAPL